MSDFSDLVTDFGFTTAETSEGQKVGILTHELENTSPSDIEISSEPLAMPTEFFADNSTVKPKLKSKKAETEVKGQNQEKTEVKTGRAKRKLVPEEEKDQKYWDMRRKNNEATKRCREAKKAKLDEFLMESETLDKKLKKMKSKHEAIEEKYNQLLKTNQSLRNAFHKMSKICGHHFRGHGHGKEI